MRDGLVRHRARQFSWARVFHEEYRVPRDTRVSAFGRTIEGKTRRVHRVIVKCCALTYYHAALTRAGDGRYSVAAEMKSPTYARDANDFFATVILLLRSSLFFMRAQDQDECI